MAAGRLLAATAAAALVLLAAVQANFAQPGVYSTAYSTQPCACTLPCSCASSYGSGYAGWAPRSYPAYLGYPRAPSVVAGDSYAVQRGPGYIRGPVGNPQGGYVGPGPVIVRGAGGPQYVNGGANGGAYVAPPIGGSRIVVGGYESIRRPVGGPNGYAQSGGYYQNGRVGPRDYPVGGGGGLGRRGSYVRGGADGYTQPGGIVDGPMATVKVILLPDGSTRSISIPARFLANTVDEYAGGANKYADPFSSLAGGKYLSEPVAAAIPVPVESAAQAAAAAAATAAAEAAVGALPASAAAAEAAAALGAGPEVGPVKSIVPYQPPSETYRSGREQPIQGEERRISNLYRALLAPQQDTVGAAEQALQPSSAEAIIEDRIVQPVLPDPRGKFDRPANLEDYIVLRKDDPRAIYLRDHLLELEQQAAKDAATAAAAAATEATLVGTAATIAPSRDPNIVGEKIVRVSTETPFSKDEQPRILKGTRAELPNPSPLKKEDVIAEFLEQQRLEASEKEKEMETAAKQAKIRKQLIEKQLAAHREQETTTVAAAASDAVAESQQEVTQDELPPGWQIGFRVNTEDSEPEQQQQQEKSQDHHEEHNSDPRAHFDREPIDVRKPRPTHRGPLIDDHRLADYRPLSGGREVAPSAIARETKSVRQAVPEFQEFFDGLR